MTEASSQPVLRLRGVQMAYGDLQVLHGIDLDVPPGITGLLGANGAGKSTLMKLALGLLTPTAGTIELLAGAPDGDASAARDVRDRVGYGPEHDCLPARASAAEAVAYLGELSGLPRTVARTRASDVLRLVGLHEERHRAIDSFSTGQKQRAKIAQALVHGPDLLVLDEPTGGLDPAGRAEILDLVATVGREFGISVLVSTHIMGDVERACDHIVMLGEGRVTHAGPVGEALRSRAVLDVEVVDGADRVAAALAARSIAFDRASATRIAVHGAGDEVLDAVRDAVAESDAAVRSLAPARRQLTELFS